MAQGLLEHRKLLLGRYLRFSGVISQSNTAFSHCSLHDANGENKPKTAVQLPKGVVIERAERRHYQGVLDILPDYLGGVDYLFFKYPSYIEDPCSYPWVALLENKVIGFVNCYVINNGTASVNTDGRVVPQLANKGIATMLTKRAQEDILKEFPNVLTSFFSAVDSKFYDPYRRKSSKGTIVYDRHFLYYSTDTKSVINLFKHLCQRKEFSSRHLSKIINKKAVEPLLQKNSHYPQFFPENHFLHGVTWLPLEANMENIIHAAGTYGTTVATTLSLENEYCSGISFGSYMQTPVGPLCSHFFHVEDIDSLLDQLCCHLDVNRELYKKSGPCFFEVIFSKGIDKSEVKREFFQYFGDTTICDDIPREGALIVEKPLKTSML